MSQDTTNKISNPWFFPLTAFGIWDGLWWLNLFGFWLGWIHRGVWSFCGRGSFGRFKTTSLRKSACSRQDIAIRSRSSLLVAVTSHSNIVVMAIFWPFTGQIENKYFRKDVFYRKHLELFNILVILLSRVSV